MLRTLGARLPLRQLKSAALEYGCGVRRTVDGEYRVNRINGSEATAYYTSDPQDALQAAAAMAGQGVNR